MRASQLSPEALHSENIYRQTAYWLVALMMACASLTISQLIVKVTPDWPMAVFAILSGLISLERLYSYRRFSSLSILSPEWLTMLGTQWVIILLALRLMIAFSNGPTGFVADLNAIGNHFFDRFFIPQYVAAIFITILNWFSSGNFGELIDEMGLRRGLIALEQDSAVPAESIPVRNRLMNLVIGQGIALVILTAILRINLRTFFNQGNEPFFLALEGTSGSLSTLLYFMLGLALLGQGQFMLLHTRWSFEGINIPAKMVTRWAAYGLGFLLLLSLAVGMLPTSFSLGFFSVMGALLHGLIAVIFFALQLLMYGFASVIGLILSLLGFKAEERVPPTPPPSPELLPANIQQQPTADPWLDLMKAALSWGILLVVIGFSLWQFVRQHEGISSALKKWSQAIRLDTLWKWLLGLWRGAGRLTRSASENLQRLFGRFSPAGNLPAFGFLNPRRLDARQRVTFYYLAMLRRGGERGLPRKPSQTPAEYAATLDPSLPEVQVEIDSLTETFSVARYAPHPVQSPDANRARSLWERIRKAMRNQGGKHPAEGGPRQ